MMSSSKERQRQFEVNDDPPLYDADARDPGDFPDAVITDCRSYQADIQHQDGSVVKYEIVVPYRDSISAPPSNGL